MLVSLSFLLSRAQRPAGSEALITPCAQRPAGTEAPIAEEEDSDREVDIEEEDGVEDEEGKDEEVGPWIGAAELVLCACEDDGGDGEAEHGGADGENCP